MGGFKEIHLEHYADASELDDHLTPDILNEGETLLLQIQTIRAELNYIIERMKKTEDRWRYYGEPVDCDEFDFLQRELSRVVKDLC